MASPSRPRPLGRRLWPVSLCRFTAASASAHGTGALSVGGDGAGSAASACEVKSEPREGTVKGVEDGTEQGPSCGCEEPAESDGTICGSEDRHAGDDFALGGDAVDRGHELIVRPVHGCVIEVGLADVFDDESPPPAIEEAQEHRLAATERAGGVDQDGESSVHVSVLVPKARSDALIREKWRSIPRWASGGTCPAGVATAGVIRRPSARASDLREFLQLLLPLFRSGAACVCDPDCQSLQT